MSRDPSGVDVMLSAEEVCWYHFTDHALLDRCSQQLLLLEHQVILIRSWFCKLLRLQYVMMFLKIVGKYASYLLQFLDMLCVFSSSQTCTKPVWLTAGDSTSRARNLSSWSCVTFCLPVLLKLCLSSHRADTLNWNSIRGNQLELLVKVCHCAGWVAVLSWCNAVT